MRHEDRRALLSGPRAEVRANEPMNLIPDQSVAALCRAMVAADIDWIERDSIIIVQGGMLVPDCVYELYNDLLGYPVPCCGCTTEPVLSFLYPSPLYETNAQGSRLVGSGFGEYESWASVTIEGYATLGPDDLLVATNNVIELWGQPVPPVGETEMVYTLTNRRGTSGPLRVPVLPKPPMFTASGYSPTTVEGPKFELTVDGTGFLPGDGVSIYLPAPGPGFRFYEATEVTSTRLIVPVDHPYTGTSKLYVERPNPIGAIRMTDITITPP